MSQTLTLARPYARAAYQAARETGTTTAWSEALAFAARVAADPRVDTLLGDPRLSRADAVALLSPTGASEGVGGFLGLLAQNGRMKLLPEIAGLFEQFRAEAEKIVRAKITSAAPMTQAELDTLVAALKRRFGREVEVEASIDESLIGGAVIDAEEVVIDGPVKGKLARLSAALTQ